MKIELSIDELKRVNAALSYYFYNEKLSEEEKDKTDDLLFELRILERKKDVDSLEGHF